MPPQRTRNIADDSRSEASSTREKYSGLFSSQMASKGRRNGPGNIGAASNLKEVTNADQSKSGQQDAPEDDKRVCQQSVESQMRQIEGPVLTNRQIEWSKMDTSVLLAYRNLHRLDAPASFINPYNERMLTRPGIGQFSPTMARLKARQRVGKVKLAMAIKKSFNNAMVSELDIITTFTYSVQNQGG